jgi:hypothetical protein
VRPEPVLLHCETECMREAERVTMAAVAYCTLDGYYCELSAGVSKRRQGRTLASRLLNRSRDHGVARRKSASCHFIDRTPLG